MFHLQVRGNEHQPWHFKPSVGTWWASQSFYPIRIRLDIFGSGPHLASKLENRSQHICLLDSACLWFRVDGFLIELAKLSTDSLRLKLNRNGWVLV